MGACFPMEICAQLHPTSIINGGIYVGPLSYVQLFVTPWTVARQAPLSMRFPRQEYCSELPFPSPGDLPKPGTEHASLAAPALTDGLFTMSSTWEGQPRKVKRKIVIRTVS